MSEHYSEGRRWSHISQAWILEAGWNDREEIARLTAENRALAAQLDQVTREWEEARQALKQKMEDYIFPNIDKLEQQLAAAQQRCEALIKTVQDREQEHLAACAEIDELQA